MKLPPYVVTRKKLQNHSSQEAVVELVVLEKKNVTQSQRLNTTDDTASAVASPRFHEVSVDEVTLVPATRFAGQQLHRLMVSNALNSIQTSSL